MASRFPPLIIHVVGSVLSKVGLREFVVHLQPRVLRHPLDLLHLGLGQLLLCILRDLLHLADLRLGQINVGPHGDGCLVRSWDYDGGRRRGRAVR